MNNLRYVNKILRTEKCHLMLKKKSEVGFWNFQMFGMLSILLNKDKDYLIITENRILYVLQSKLIKDVQYHNLSEIKFNVFNDTISYKNLNNENEIISIKNFRITYEEIQKLKKAIN